MYIHTEKKGYQGQEEHALIIYFLICESRHDGMEYSAWKENTNNNLFFISHLVYCTNVRKKSKIYIMKDRLLQSVRLLYTAYSAIEMQMQLGKKCDFSLWNVA